MEPNLLEATAHTNHSGAAAVGPGIMERNGLQQLLILLRQRGYQVIGPVLRDGAIVYEEIESIDQLPAGYSDAQERGTYRLKKRNDDALFAYTVGPISWKKYLFPPVQKLWSADQTENGFTVHPNEEPVPRMAFIGVHGCDLAAIEQLDRVFLHGPYVDPVYAVRRQNTFIVAVNCTRSAATCFCTSMGTGPQVTRGVDLILTEIIETTRHAFLIEASGLEGASLLEQLPARAASDTEVAAARSLVERAARGIRRRLDTSDVHDLLLQNQDYPYWENLANRCLSCGNCTMVCPTCFCNTVEDVTDLSGNHTDRWRKWDSCFNADHSYIVGGSIHGTTRSRYRQWLTHKLATWQDQFGASGCTGCGRCISWCPAGIDLTEEIEILRNAVSRTASDL